MKSCLLAGNFTCPRQLDVRDMPWCMPSMSLYLGTVEILRHDSYLLLKFQVYQTLLEAMMKPQK